MPQQHSRQSTSSSLFEKQQYPSSEIQQAPLNENNSIIRVDKPENESSLQPSNRFLSEHEPASTLQSVPLNLAKSTAQYSSEVSSTSATPGCDASEQNRFFTPVKDYSDNSNSLHIGKANEGSPIQRIMKFEPKNLCRSQSGVHQNSLVEVQYVETASGQEELDRNNNHCKVLISEEPTPVHCYEDSSDDGRCQTDGSTSMPTSFGGLFPRQEPQQQTITVVDQSHSDIEIYRQSYIQTGSRQQGQETEGQLVEYDHAPADYIHQQLHGTDCQQQGSYVPHQQEQMDETPSQMQNMADNGRQEETYIAYQQYEPSLEDQHIAAEQLATELVQRYGGKNSHRVRELLKPNVEEQGYVFADFERSTEMEPYENVISHQQVIHEVDLLNTPQQLPPIEESFRDINTVENVGQPQASSTPDAYRKNEQSFGLPQFHGSATYNDVHLHGGSWSQQVPLGYNQHQGEASESPFPPERNSRQHDENSMNYRYSSHQAGNYLQTDGDNRTRVPFRDKSLINIPPTHRQSGAEFPSPNSSFGSPNLQGFRPHQTEVTKMTFTPREMMESHLSQSYQKRAGQNRSFETAYSSIYPSKDFIEQATGNSGRGNKRYSKSGSPTQRKKRVRASKYSTEDVPKVPPQMPIFDDMLQKYPPMLPRDEVHGGKHKYFVVNPSEITNMPAKNLITKYIDFLILENEQITEISKSSNPPVDIYVTEDMYFMDSLKFVVQFPSRKFIEWVASFYPRLNFLEMTFKGRHPRIPPEGQALQVDSRSTQQILEDTFYYFQRELMNTENTKV